MNDHHQISDLLIRYATGIDRRDWPLLRTVFTTDCVLDYGEIGNWHGVDAVTEFMEQAHAMAGQTLHRITNVVVAVDGDRATARSYVDGLIMAADGALRGQRRRVLRRRGGPHRRGLAGGPAPVHRGAGGGGMTFRGRS